MITCPRVLCKYRSSTGQVEIMMEGGMTMAGRKPKPTAIKKLEGNSGKRKLNTKEPIPAKGMPNCPEWLLAEAKKEWERLADLMNQMGVLTEVDMVALLHTVSLMPDGRKHRSILLRRVLPLRLIKDISNRHLGLVLQIQIRS